MELKKGTRNIPKPTNFGKNLRFLRRLMGLTQAKLAEEIGLSRNNVASYESGLIEPNVDKFLKVCKFFDKAPEDMLEYNYSDVSPEELSLRLGEETTAPKFASEQLQAFIAQTQEMTKILEGYTAFYELKSSTAEDQKSKELFSTLEDLLSILHELIQSNWSLIQDMNLQVGDENI